MITLTSARLADSVCHERAAVRLVSVLSEAFMIPTPDCIAAENHLKLVVDDKSRPIGGYEYPRECHIRELLDWGESWDGESELVIHCWEGRSRSPAAMALLLLQKNPGRELDIIHELVRRAPHVRPNQMIIKIGDRILECDGRLVASVKSLQKTPIVDFNSYVSFPVFLESPRVLGGT